MNILHKHQVTSYLISGTQDVLNWFSVAPLAFALVLGSGSSGLAQTQNAAGWDQVQVAESGSATGVVCITTTGAVFACGQVKDPNYRAAILKSDDMGVTWSRSWVANNIAGSGAVFAFFRDITTAMVRVGGSEYEHLFAVGATVLAPPAIPSGNYLYAWEVYRSTDLGQTWHSLTDPIVLSGYFDQAPYEIAADGEGHVYIAGGARKRIEQKSRTTFETYGIILKGTRTAGAEPASDTYSWNTISNTAGSGVGTILCAGANVFVTRNGDVGWQVQKSINGGVSWMTIDQISRGSAQGMTIDSSGALIVAGSLPRKGGSSWAVRKGTQNGAFTTVGQGEIESSAIDVTVDLDGTVHVIGRNSGVSGWITRQGVESGGTWSWIESDGPFGTAGAKGITSDSEGNVYVVGRSTNGDDSAWLVRRRIAP